MLYIYILLYIYIYLYLYLYLFIYISARQTKVWIPCLNLLHLIGCIESFQTST